MTTQTLYSDLTTNFIIHPVKGDLILLTNENAVKRSIINLMFTEPYERFFSPNIGAGLKAYLFENITQDTEFLIKEKIKEVITNYEPRANLINVSVKALPDQNMYSASIIFSVLNNINPVTLDVLLRRVR
jgi:phage baseplate assembly protein W